MNFFKSGSLVILSLFMLTSCSNLDIQTLNQKANELMNSGNVDGAIARLESINDLNPNFPETHYNLGIAYHKKGDYKKSVDSLTKAVNLDKNFADAYYSLGVIHEEIGLTELDKNKNKENVNKSENLGLIVENFKKSRDAFSKYLEIDKQAQDADNIKSKIEFLNSDIAKYESILLKGLDNNTSHN